MLSVVIIGFGSIGKRHYESCLKNKFITKIYIIENNNKQLKNYDFSIKKKTIITLKKTVSITEDIFLTIVATNSNDRYRVTLNFLRMNICKNIIFEKFLFNKISEYNYMSIVLKKKKIRAYVNCNRRLSKDYIRIKKVYFNKILGIKIIGSKWGFLSNSIHFIDLFSFLTDLSKFKLNLETLHIEKIIPSKRKDYLELQSTINIKSNNFFLSISDSKNHNENKILIYLKNKILNILETKNLIFSYSTITKKKYNKTKFSNLYVSFTTNIAINNILKYNNAGLVSFEESAIHHKFFLRAIKNKVNIDNLKFT